MSDALTIVIVRFSRPQRQPSAASVRLHLASRQARISRALGIEYCKPCAWGQEAETVLPAGIDPLASVSAFSSDICKERDQPTNDTWQPL